MDVYITTKTGNIKKYLGEDIIPEEGSKVNEVVTHQGNFIWICKNPKPRALLVMKEQIENGFIFLYELYPRADTVVPQENSMLILNQFRKEMINVPPTNSLLRLLMIIPPNGDVPLINVSFAPMESNLDLKILIWLCYGNSERICYCTLDRNKWSSNKELVSTDFESVSVENKHK